MKHFLSTILFCLAVGVVSAQTPAEKFTELLSKMSSETVQDRQFKERENAQLEWQKICMEATATGREEDLAAVNKLMVEQLDKDIPLETKYWLLQQLQWTGDDAVVPAIAKLLDDKDLRIRDRAARALALNPAPAAETALQNALKSADGVRAKTITDALNARKPDLAVGVESLDPMDLPYVSEAKFDAWMNGFDKLDAQDKVRTLAAVKVRKAAKYVDTALAATKSEDEDLRYAGLYALEKIATVKEVPALIDLLFSLDRGKVEWVFTGISAPGVDEALLKTLGAEKDAGRFAAIATVLAKRSVKSAKDAILARAGADGVENRLQMLQSAEAVASKDDVPAFVNVALMIPMNRGRDQADQIIARLCNGDAEPVVGMAKTPALAAELLPVVGRIGGNAGLAFVKAQYKVAANTNAAVRALCNWPNATVADDLIALAKDNTASNANRLAALRAFIRVITLPDDQIGIRISAKDKIAKLREALKLAVRVEEKRLIIDRASAIRSPESVVFALEFIDDADVQQNACRTIIDIAHHNNVRRPHAAIVGPALDKVIERVKDAGQKERAQKYREDM